jgi:G3E family GTPase
MNKIPVNIISGFLGSGKSSAITRLLAQKNSGERWAIVVNEFGKISIDAHTLQSKSVSGTVFGISGGCICCSAKAYLRENLPKIIDSESFDRIIIEPSGLGGIEMVTEIVESFPHMNLRPVICLVDITVIDNQRIQRNMIYRTQIANAKMIVFSKCDLIADMEVQDQLVKQFKTLFPEKVHCFSGVYLSTALLDMDFQCIYENSRPLYFTGNSNLKDKNYQKKHFQFGVNSILDSEKLIHFFKDYPDIFRVKGYIQTENGWKLFNFTLSGSTFEPCKAKEKSELVLIAQKMENQILPDFKEIIGKTCLIGQPN